MLVTVLFHFVSFQLRQVMRGRADASKMAIASGIAICLADGLPPLAHFPCACLLAEVCLLAHNFRISCSRFILGVALMGTAWNDMEQHYNEMKKG